MDPNHHVRTAPADRIPTSQKFAYGVGSLVNNLLGAAIGMMAIVLNLGLGMDPVVVGTLMALPRFVDALTDPVMGYISDHSRWRWGRRRPYIFFGAIASGIVFALLWQLPAGYGENFYFWYFLIGANFFYLAYTVYATPWVALGYEMTPDYNERTRLMGVSNFMGQFAWVAVPWFYAFMENDRFFPDSVTGARWLAVYIGIFVAIFGLVPALLCRERMQAIAESEDSSAPAGSMWQGLGRNLADFFRGFLATMKFRPFLLLCGATFLVFNGFMLVSAFSSYVIIYYVYGGDKDLGAQLMGWNGTLSALATFLVILLATWLGTRIGKQKTFFIATAISVVGYLLKWFCYSKTHPFLILLPTPFIAFGLGALFTLMGSMMADVCDFDELKSGQRREGMFGAVFWWVVKLGMALALALSGYALNYTGFDVALGGAQSDRTLFLMRLLDVSVPAVTSLIAIALVARYPLSEAKTREVRAELERRRGRVGAAA
jgi:glycoside/pentoside/hexuronide:cation symporter, GPH family